MKINKQQVLEILNRLLEQAYEIEADVGTTPTAMEALDWAISEVNAISPID